MDSHGRILIPASIRRVMQISPLSNLVIKVTGNQLTIDTI
jgi:bifunctional DNA-binding transcriptional regulator/antitoxin component of YhaV-PrlF toxin-antitoxin module